MSCSAPVTLYHIPLLKCIVIFILEEDIVFLHVLSSFTFRVFYYIIYT